MFGLSLDGRFGIRQHTALASIGFWKLFHLPRPRRFLPIRTVAADTNRARQFYICGVGKGVTRIRDLLRGSGYERRAVHYEQW